MGRKRAGGRERTTRNPQEMAPAFRANVARRTTVPVARGASVVAFAGKGRPHKDDAKGDAVTGKDTSKPKNWDEEQEGPEVRYLRRRPCQPEALRLVSGFSCRP